MIWSIPAMWQFPELFDVFANDQPQVDFQNPGHMLLPTFPSFRSMGMVGKTCLPNNAYYPQAPDYTLYSGVHIYWSEHSDSSFIYGFMSLNYCLGTMTATTFIIKSMLHFRKEYTLCHDLSLLVPSCILSNKKLNQKSQDTRQFFFFFFFLIWVLRPFQEYFTYIEPIVHRRWAKTGEPGEKPPDHP